MKFLSLAASFILIGSVNASTSVVTVDESLFDCDFAAETAKQSVINKQSGLTLKKMRELTRQIPSSSGKTIYVYYSELGFKFNDKTQAHQFAYKSCQENKV